MKFFIFLNLMLAFNLSCKPELSGQASSKNLLGRNPKEKQTSIIFPDFKRPSKSICDNSAIEIRNKHRPADLPHWSSCQLNIKTGEVIENAIEAYFNDKISSFPTLNEPDFEGYFCTNASPEIYNFFSDRSFFASPNNALDSPESNCSIFFSKRNRLQSLILKVSNKTSVAPLKFSANLRTLDLQGESIQAEVEGLHFLTQIESLSLKSLRFNFAELINLKKLKSLHIDNIEVNLALKDWRILRGRQGLKLYSGNLSQLTIKNSKLIESALVSIASIQSLCCIELVNNQLKNIATLATMKSLRSLSLNKNPHVNLVDLIEIIDSTELSSLYFDNETRKLISHSLPLSEEN
ncbi:MAG: hypothetical protein KBD78_15445 [Oligoflexales bacterium]|nr:hypothetical protein [Oligoflexales bacterium]